MSAGSERIKKEDILSIMEDIKKLPAAKKIALRRCCGKLLKEADARAAIAFYQLYSLPKEFDWAKDRLFAAVCMRCLWDADEKKEDGGKKDNMISLETVLHNKRKELEKQDSDGWSSMERRLLRLLDRKWNRDGLLCMDLWRMVKQMKNEGHVIDMVSLGLDLCNWNAESRTVQQRWLQVCYQEKEEEE